MVSQKSIIKGCKNLKSFMSAHPDADVKQASKALGRFAHETSEARITAGTLSSVFAPTPKYIADRIDRRLKKRF